MIKDEIKQIKIIMSHIRIKTKKYRKVVLPKKLKKISLEIRGKLDHTRNLLEKIGKKMKKIKINLYDKSSRSDITFLQWQKNIFNICIREYEEVFDQYQNEIQYFNKVKKERIKLMVKIINTNFSGKQIDKLVKKPEIVQRIIKKKILSKEFLNNLIHLEEIRIVMLDIEEEMKKLMEMIFDYNILLTLQSQQIDIIKENIIDVIF